MRVIFRLSRRDLIIISIRGILHQPILLGIFGFVLIVTSFTNWTAIDKERTLLVRIITFTVLELVPIGFLILFLAVLMLLMSRSKGNNRLLTEQTLIVDEKGLIIESELSKSEIKWSAVQRLRRSGPYLFLYFSQQAATVIPRRAFDSEQSWDQFYKYCRSRVDLALA